jgi:hypothetical protein
VLDFSERNTGVLLVAVIVLGVVLRGVYFGRYWLNSDEGIYWLVATETPAEAARLVRGNAHPPLFYLLLRAVHSLGGGIEAMRAFSLAAGIALPAVVFLVARCWAGSAAGIFAALMIVNAPGVRELSLLMRPYAVLSVALGLGTVCLFRFLEGGRLRSAIAWGFCWTVAMFLHYSTYLVLAGAVAYGGWLIATARVERRTALGLLWVLGLISLVGGWLYLNHVHSSMQGSVMQLNAQEVWLRGGFPDDPLELLLSYFRSARHLFGDPFAIAAVFLVPAAVWLGPDPGRRRPALLTLLILAVAGLLSCLEQYPLGRSRHSFYLITFAAPAAAVALVGLLASRRLAPLGLLCLLLAASTSLIHPGLEDELPVRRADARALAEGLRAEIPPGDLILLDRQSYYLSRPLLGDIEGLSDTYEVLRFESEGRHYLVFPEWYLEIDEQRDELRDQLAALETPLWGNPDSGGRRVWLLHGGWGSPFCRQLRKHWPDRVDTEAWLFERRGLMVCRLADGV